LEEEGGEAGEMDEVWWALEDLYNDELSKIEHEG
jgi:hypothetical protein